MPTPQEISNLHAVVPASQAAAREYGVPASVTLAQWILESSWGLSALCVKANNCFGIKCNHQAAPEAYIEMPTGEIENGRRVVIDALFAKYPSVAASFTAHAQLLALAARYRRAMASSDHPQAFAVALQQCGYSTNPNYATELLQLMRLYNLTQYDVTPPAAPLQQVAA
jgi:flagellum-specific peptidoglycan hydrolase FlgJ